jgi:hypothetical protein
MAESRSEAAIRARWSSAKRTPMGEARRGRPRELERRPQGVADGKAEERAAGAVAVDGAAAEGHGTNLPRGRT